VLSHDDDYHDESHHGHRRVHPVVVTTPSSNQKACKAIAFPARNRQCSEISALPPPFEGDLQQSHDSIVHGRELVQLEVGHVEDRRGLAGWHAPHGKVTVLGQEPVTP
jgi:hypothetical protein